MNRSIRIVLLACCLPAGAYGQQPIVDLSVNTPDRIERQSCFTRAVAASALFRCGELAVVHAMPAFRTMNEDRSLTLLYSSATALPQTVLGADVTITGGAAPDSVYALLSIGSLTYYYRFSGAGFSANGPPRRIALRYANVYVGIATGVHPYSVTVISFFQGSTWTHVASSTTIEIDRTNSPYGAGWDVAGTERLWFGQPGGILHSSGDGSAALYAGPGRRPKSRLSPW